MEINKSQLESEILPIRQQAEMMQILTDADNISAANFLMTVKGMIKKVKDTFSPAKETAWKAHKEIVALEAQILKPLESAEAGLKQKMITFERQVEIERQRLQAIQEAEARRIEAEARKLEEQARKAEEKGREAQALAKADAAIAVQVKADEVRQVVIEKPMTKNTGISYMTVWKFEITSPADVPLGYRMIDEKKIASVVKATKGTLQIAGVRIYSEKIISSKSF